MAVTLGFLWAFAKIDAYSHFTVLIFISWLKFETTGKMTTEEQKEPERWRQQEQEQRKKGILSKNNASTRAFEARYMVPPLSQEKESDKWLTSLHHFFTTKKWVMVKQNIVVTIHSDPDEGFSFETSLPFDYLYFDRTAV